MANLTKEILSQIANEKATAPEVLKAEIEAFKEKMKLFNPFAKKTFNLTNQIQLQTYAPELAKKLEAEAMRGDDFPGRFNELRASIDELKKSIEQARRDKDEDENGELDFDGIQKRIDALYADLEKLTK